MSELADEDPATGSAAGPLMAYANVRLGARHLEVTQGVEMGHPEPAARRGWRTGARRVGGDVVVLVTGTLRLPGGARYARGEGERQRPRERQPAADGEHLGGPIASPSGPASR